MSPTPKSPKKQDANKNARNKGRYKNLDKNRWRKVGVWVIPLVFTIPLGVAFSAHGANLIPASVVAALIGLYYVLFLVEWYVWKHNPARKRGRILFGLLCILVIALGFLWHSRAPLITDGTKRPRVWVKELNLINLSPGQEPKLEFVFENIGHTPAVEFTNETTAIPTTRVFTTEADLPQIPATTPPAKGFIPEGQVITKTIALPHDRPIDEQDIKLLKDDKVFLYVYGSLHYYGDDRQKDYTTTFCGRYKILTNTFQACTFHNAVE